MLRKSLFAAAAVAPLALVLGGPATAASVGDTSSQVKTSTANNGQPADVTITGTVKATTSAPAVVIDSSNSVTNQGTVTSNNVDGSIGVQLQGGNAGTLTNTGSINILEDYTPTDTNNDGVVDGAFAKGTGRYGVQVVDPSGAGKAFVGSIVNSGSITVKGQNSYGIAVLAPLTGTITGAGTITMTGENSVGLYSAAKISDRVVLSGAISSTGTGARGVNLQGDVGNLGQNASGLTRPAGLAIYAPIVATGYRITQRNLDPSVNATLLKTPGDVTQSGSAVTIGGNLAGGLYLGAAPIGTNGTNTTVDADHDGIVDSAEGTGSITVYGQAPALLVGGAGKTITLGAFDASTAGNQYGVILRGNVVGSGIYDGISATAIQLGATDSSGNATGQVAIAGGVRTVGNVTASAFEASAWGIHAYNTNFNELVNSGTISVSSTFASKTAAGGAAAVLLESGANVPYLNNTGVISATLNGDNPGYAYAVQDKSGTLASVSNTNVVQAVIAPTVGGDATQGRAIAFDLSHNTSGITFFQGPGTVPTATTNSDGTVTVTQTATTPKVLGDILLGTGSNAVDLEAGSVVGALSYGAGGSLTINNATYQGALTAPGPLAINVGTSATNTGASVLENHSPTTVQVSNLNVGANGTLVFAADPANTRATLFNVQGTATVASGGKLGLYLNSLPSAPLSQVVLQAAGGLNISGNATDLTGEEPYLFVANFTPNPQAGTITLNLRRRTAAEAGLNASQAAALDPIYNALSKDTEIQRAFLAQTTQAGLQQTLNMMLPDHAGGVFRALSAASEQLAIAAGDPPLGQDQAGPTRAWTNEIVIHEQRDPDLTPGYRILGFAAQGGVESVSSHGDALGARIGFTTSNVTTPNLPSDNLLGVSEFSGGVYWRGRFGGLRADAQLGAGFIWANNRREFLYSDTTGVVHRTAKGSWDGYSLNGRFGVAYHADLGRFFVEPRAHVDYFRLHESGYTESGGGATYDLTVADRTGDLLSAEGSLLIGTEWGTGWRWRPQVEIGYRDVFMGSAGDTTAVVASGGTPFSLAAESIRGGAVTGNVGLRIYSDYLDLLLQAGAEVSPQYTDIEANLTARTVF